MMFDLLPGVFQELIHIGVLQQGDISSTSDEFYLSCKSISDILAQKDILDFPDSTGEIMLCSRFFDDWYLYCVGRKNSTCGLLKLREQEFDAQEDSPADGDTPGVTVSFIAFSCEYLLQCLNAPTPENRSRLNTEINRVVSYKNQQHHIALKQYFIDPKAQGAYLVADAYTRHIASFTENGSVAVPVHYQHIVQQSRSYKHSAKLSRLPDFIDSLNAQAGYTVCDHSRIYIRDKNCLTQYECLAILATHTGNTSPFSFAAEVEYHAKFLFPLAKLKLPFFGRSIYASAIRADMTIDDGEFEGTAPFYRSSSIIVKRQRKYHNLFILGGEKREKQF